MLDCRGAHLVYRWWRLAGHRFGTMPVLTLLGVVLGLAAAGYQLWELARVGGKIGNDSGRLASNLLACLSPRAAPGRRMMRRHQMSPIRESGRNEE